MVLGGFGCEEEVQLTPRFLMWDAGSQWYDKLSGQVCLCFSPQHFIGMFLCFLASVASDEK